VAGVFRRPTFRDNVPCLVSACQPRKLALSLLPALFSSSHTPPPSSPCRPTSIACKRRCAQITRPLRCTRSPTWHCCIGLLRRYWLGSVYRAMMHQTPTRKGSTTGKKTCYTTIFFFSSKVTCRNQDVKWLAVTAPQRQRGLLQADPEPGFRSYNLSIDYVH
jgi:hypothetical protein